MTPDFAKAIITEFNRLDLDCNAGVNLLVERGIVSDQVVGLGDIATEDCARAVAFLKANKSANSDVLFSRK